MSQLPSNTQRTNQCANRRPVPRAGEICFLSVCLVFLLGVGSAPALDVGVASCDITPDVKGHKVPVLRVDGADGKCRALLVHFATHPTLLGASNMLISAEWPGVLQQALEAAFPGAVALYSNGAEGDQSPAGAQGADDFERVKDFGTRLAQRAQSVARTIETKPDQAIGFVRITPDLPPIAFSRGARNGPYQSFEPLARTALPKQAEIQLLRIGDTALVGLPGEPICDVGLDTQKQVATAGFERVLIIGLANDYLGYIVNEKEYAHGGYEVDQRSYYGPGLGRLLATKAGEAARKLAGAGRPERPGLVLPKCPIPRRGRHAKHIRWCGAVFFEDAPVHCCIR